MKKFFICLFLAFLGVVQAADEVFYFSIQDAIDSKFGKEYLKNIDVEFVFGEYKGKDIIIKENVKLHRSSIKHRSKYIARKEELIEFEPNVACNYVFAVALRDLAAAAKKEGATKLVNIRNNFKNNLYQDSDKFQCARGRTVTSVHFLADYAK